MFTLNQLYMLYDYTKYCRMEAEHKAAIAKRRTDIETNLKASIVAEQNRRKRELERLEKVIQTEISSFTKGSESNCPGEIIEHTPHNTEAKNSKRQKPSAKRTTSTKKKKTTKGGGSRGRKKKTTGETS